MIDGVEVRRPAAIRDTRGRLCELVRRDTPGFDGFGQLYFTTVRPGVVKAWHLHERQTDLLIAVDAPLVIALVDARAGSPTEGQVMELIGGRAAPLVVRVPAGVYHGFACAGDEEAMLLNVPSEPYDHDAPDELRLDPFDNPLPYDWRARGATRGG